MPAEPTYTYSTDPATSDLDAVRALLGDVGPTTWLLSDETILWQIEQEGRGRRAAAACCEILATMSFTGSSGSVAEKVIGDLRIKYGSGSGSGSAAATDWLRIAALLRRRNARGAMPAAGGIDTADRADETDEGLLPPSFRRGMDDHT